MFMHSLHDYVILFIIIIIFLYQLKITNIDNEII